MCSYHSTCRTWQSLTLGETVLPNFRKRRQCTAQPLPQELVSASWVTCKARDLLVSLGCGVLLLSPWVGTAKLSHYRMDQEPRWGPLLVPDICRLLPIGTPEASAKVPGFTDETDSVEPFTLYGSTTKKYSIEEKNGEKIVRRRTGFTVETCVSGTSASAEMVDGRPPSEKVVFSLQLIRNYP
eukprot:jgi/Botrbrau1/12511/Bobra.0169s0053.1